MNVCSFFGFRRKMNTSNIQVASLYDGRGTDYLHEPTMTSDTGLDFTMTPASPRIPDLNDTMLGSNTTDTIYPLLKQPVYMIVIYSVAYLAVFCLGVVGNFLVVSVVYRNARMHNVTNLFIVNLAIADILVCIFCLPITLLSNIFTGKCYLFIYVLIN